jgi:hypothetical protein
MNLSYFPTGVNLPHPSYIGKTGYATPVFAMANFIAVNPGATDCS